MPEHDFAHVGVHGFAQVGDRVHEGDLGREERVRRVLDHLRRRGIGDEDRRLDLAVQRRHPDRDLGVVAADDHAVRREHVAHRLPFAQELGVRGDAHIGDGTRRLERAARPRRWNRPASSTCSRRPCPARSTGAISRATASTTERSAAPVSDCGVCTQMNTNSARAAASCAPTTNFNRPELSPSATSAGRPSSRIGTSPFDSARTRVLVDVGADDTMAQVREARGGGDARRIPRRSPRCRSPRAPPRHSRPFLDVLAERVAPRPQGREPAEAQGAVVERAHTADAGPGRSGIAVIGATLSASRPRTCNAAVMSSWR